MEQFFADLQPTIENAVRHAMEKIHREIGKEHIYSAALVTDSDCITLFLAVNTEEALAKRDETDRTPERLAELGEYFPVELLNRIADGSFSLNRYIPDEWGYSDGTGSELNQVSRQLSNQEEALFDTDDDTDELQEQFQNQLLETAALAFETLRAEGVFAPETLCFISMSDDDRAPDIEDSSARRLNTPEQYEQFRTWTRLFNS
nr:DUF4303 domain-containing protein [uncultured Acetatifactor sp.]